MSRDTIEQWTSHTRKRINEGKDGDSGRAAAELAFDRFKSIDQAIKAVNSRDTQELLAKLRSEQQVAVMPNLLTIPLIPKGKSDSPAVG